MLLFDMRALLEIRDKLIKMRADPVPDGSEFYDAAWYLRDANEIAAQYGIDPEPVGEVIWPMHALAAVNRFILKIEPEKFLTIPEAAGILRVSHAKVSEWIKTNRLKAVNVANPGKRPQYRISRSALENIQPEKPFKFKHLKP